MAERFDELPDGEVADGENPEHWVSVYGDLLAANNRLLAEIETFSSDEVDAEILGRHIHRLEERLAVWRKRLPG